MLLGNLFNIDHFWNLACADVHSWSCHSIPDDPFHFLIMTNLTSHPLLSACVSDYPTHFANQQDLETKFAARQATVQATGVTAREHFPLTNALKERSRFNAFLARQSTVRVIGKNEPIDAIGFRPQDAALREYPVRVVNTGEGITASDGMTLCTSVLLTSTPEDKSRRENSIYHAPTWATKTPEVIRAHKEVYDSQGWQTKAVVFVGGISEEALADQIRHNTLAEIGWDDIFERRSAMADPELRATFQDIEARAPERAKESLAAAAAHTDNIRMALSQADIPVIKTLSGIPEKAIFGAQSSKVTKNGKDEMSLSIFANGRLEA